LVAVFASKMFGGAGYADGVDMGGQAVTQITGVLATLGWSAVATVVLLIIVKRTVGLRASDAHIEEGLDLAAHGERAFTP
ncbi:MAG TPA: ammonium transporter, partial [Caulobacteraceae bacterium]|nr:ammonium transporter [Caulobacteraceae bacterium]